jgi:hypothetical protein
MSESASKKRVPRKRYAPASSSRSSAIKTEPSRPAKDRTDDSDDIERAVYDGMQDLRAEKPK